jgi:hypothetical protein
VSQLNTADKGALILNKPAPAPHVPGNTDAERMDNALRKILTVSKEDLLKEEAKWKRTRARKKRATKPN